MNDDIVTFLREDACQYGEWENACTAEGPCPSCMAADEIERLRSVNRALKDAYESLAERHRSYNNQQIGVLQRTIHDLETKIGWYKAVNTQLQADLAQANNDFQRLARTPAPTLDPLDAIVLSLKRENEARKDMR